MAETRKPLRLGARWRRRRRPPWPPHGRCRRDRERGEGGRPGDRHRPQGPARAPSSMRRGPPSASSCPIGRDAWRDATSPSSGPGPTSGWPTGIRLRPRAWRRCWRGRSPDLPSIVDQSHGRTLLRVTGPRVRDALAKGVADRSPSARVQDRTRGRHGRRPYRRPSLADRRPPDLRICRAARLCAELLALARGIGRRVRARICRPSRQAPSRSELPGARTCAVASVDASFRRERTRHARTEARRGRSRAGRDRTARPAGRRLRQRLARGRHRRGAGRPRLGRERQRVRRLSCWAPGR